MNVETRGIVLKESPQGEKGKRLVIYTKDFGKITCFAKNVRNKNVAVATMLSYSDLKMYQNRNSYQLIEGTVLKSFEGVKQDLFKISYAMYFMEFLDVVGKEGLESRDNLKLLLYALKALEDDKIADTVIKNVFELKLMQVLGFEPQLYRCVSCSSEDVHYFSSLEGGLICSKCKLEKDPIPIDVDSIDVMRFILATPIEKLFSFDLKDDIKLVLERVLKDYVDRHIQYRFNTLDFLKNLKTNII